MSIKSPVNRPEADLGMLGEFRTDEILYEAESPIVFTVVANGRSYLSYEADHTPEARWFLLAPCNEKILSDLRRGALPVRDALTSSWMWLARVNAGDTKPSAAWAVTPSDVPPENLPMEGTPLFHEHEAVLSTRAIGARIVAGEVPASVVGFVSDGTRKAVKTILDFLMNPADVGGRPPDHMRALYDLPVSRAAFQSFELSFVLPKENLLFMSHDLDRAAALLQRGLAWASGSDSRPLEASSDEERRAVLDAILPLTPPTNGPIEQVTVNGTWMTRGITSLTRASRRRVRAEIARLRTEHVVKKTGRIGELDVDRQSFTLRDTGSADIRCSYGDAQSDEVWDAFHSQESTVIAGIERDGKLFVSAVASAGVAGG